ncbi:hypothetical protein [Moraxella canis]|uniref:Uncharacterized protein n=1 Tax=Moraxella canis TaxID=90239 RepID=A0A1S9ZR23_9GAMM|nr:hypothetical protein [Moraxella canis]OOR85481.1 hypothetical protein B0180_01440 [Moraxella canis]
MKKFILAASSLLLLTAYASEQPAAATNPQATHEPTEMLYPVVTDSGILYSHDNSTEEEIEAEINRVPPGTVRCGSAFYPLFDILQQEEKRILYNFTTGPEWIECTDEPIFMD